MAPKKDPYAGASGGASGSTPTGTPTGDGNANTDEDLVAVNRKLREIIRELEAKKAKYKSFAVEAEAQRTNQEQDIGILREALRQEKDAVEALEAQLATVGGNPAADQDQDPFPQPPGVNMAAAGDGRHKVPHFYGDPAKDLLSPALWIDNIEKLAGGNNWTNAQKLDFTVVSLQDNAGVWRQNEKTWTPEIFATWDNFKPAFLKRFSESKTPVEAVKLITALRQKHDETAKNFWDRVNACVNAATEDHLRQARAAWGADDAAQDSARTGYFDSMSYFIRVLFVGGLRPAIRSIVESKFSSLVTREQLLAAAVEAEVAVSGETVKIMELEAQLASLRGFGAGRGRGSGTGPPRFGQYNPHGRGRGGANPGGNPGSGPHQGQNPSGLTHRMRVALRTSWILCHKCGQWGKHRATECKVSNSRLQTLARQDPNKPPSGPPRDPHFDAVLSEIPASYQASDSQDSKN
jgi:hypothetical protein